jgi:hypothetical protein
LGGDTVLKRYYVCVEVRKYRYIDVEANSPDEAVLIASDMAKPKGKELVFTDDDIPYDSDQTISESKIYVEACYEDEEEVT